MRPDYADRIGNCPCDGLLSAPSPFPPVAETFDSCEKAVSPDFCRAALNFALLSDVPLPSQGASCGCKTKKGARHGWIPNGFLRPFWDPLYVARCLSPHFGRALRHVARCRHPLSIFLDPIGLLYELWRMVRSEQRERAHAQVPDAERAGVLTASHLAAGEHGTWTLGRGF